MSDVKSESFSLRDKVIIVTGGASVLGTALSMAIARAGGKVVIIGRNEIKAEQVATEINKQFSSHAIGIARDVLKEEKMIAACDKAMATFDRVDGLMNADGGNIHEGVLSPDKDVFIGRLRGLAETRGVALGVLRSLAEL